MQVDGRRIDRARQLDLLPVEAGHDTHANIPGAEMHVVPGMGHNLPKHLIPKICDLIERATARARESA